MKFKQLITMPGQLWNNYWFKPAPLFNLAICRILIIGYQTFYLFNNHILDRLKEFSSLPDFLYNPLPILQFFFFPFGWDYRPPFLLLASIFGLTIVTGIMGTIGLFTNPSLIVFAIGNIILQAYLYSFRDFHHSEALVMISLSIMALSIAGRNLSFDDLREKIKLNLKRDEFKAFDIKEKQSSLARWPILLIQWIFAIIYLDSGVSKLLKGGLNWMNGYTLQYYLWQDGLIWDRGFGLWFAKQHTLAVLSSWVAIIFEVTFPLVLLFPRLVWFYIPLGASFHSGIYLAQKAPFLKYIPSYSAFIPWSAIAFFFSRRQKFSQTNNQLEVIYNSQSPQTIRLMTILCYFNWFDRLTFTDIEIKKQNISQQDSSIFLEDEQQHIYVVLANGSTHKDFLALRKILKYLPPLWPLLIVFYFPPNSLISRKIYNLIIQK